MVDGVKLVHGLEPGPLGARSVHGHPVSLVAGQVFAGLRAGFELKEQRISPLRGLRNHERLIGHDFDGLGPRLLRLVPLFSLCPAGQLVLLPLALEGLLGLCPGASASSNVM